MENAFLRAWFCLKTQNGFSKTIVFHISFFVIYFLLICFCLHAGRAMRRMACVCDGARSLLVTGRWIWVGLRGVVVTRGVATRALFAHNQKGGLAVEVEPAFIIKDL